MPDYCFYLDRLSPTQALQVLAEAAAETDGNYLDAVTLQISHGPFGPEVTLVVPDVRVERGRRKEREARQQALDVIINAYEKIKSRKPRRGPAAGNSIPLSKGVAWLLLNSGNSPNEEPAPEMEGEYLIIGRGMDLNRVARIFEDLRFHTTHTHIAAAETKAGKTLYLFHVLDDQQRRSSFLSAVAGDAFSGCSILTCFSSKAGSVFLPEEIKPDTQKLSPGRQGLTYFCRFLQAAPSLFRPGGVKADHSLLAAIDQWPLPDKGSEEPARLEFEMVYLADLTFHSQIKLTPDAAYYADFEVYDLTATETALPQLREAIEEAEPHVGYRLELRPTRHREPIETERIRLREQQIELEYKLAYLDSVVQPRPTLLRFTQKQLPALADVIRSFPERIIREGILKYGFQATDSDPAGLHFIFVEPQHATMTELDPLLRWQDLDDRPIRFWLDPYWARYYHDQGNECLVFVPQGTALFPSMHAWDVGSMDHYMRAIMGHWFHGHHGVADIPAKPIYIFDGEAHPDAQIQISVLDQAKLQPLQTQLGWLNDNLIIMDAAIGVEAFIQEMAREVTRRDLARCIEREASAAEKTFAATAKRTSDRIAAKTIELTKVITEKINRIIEETVKTTAEIRQLDQRLQKQKAIRTDMDKVSNRVDKLTKQTRKQSKDVKGFTKSLEEEVKSALVAAEKSRKRIYEQVSTEIEKLRRTRDELRQMVAQLTDSITQQASQKVFATAEIEGHQTGSPLVLGQEYIVLTGISKNRANDFVGVGMPVQLPNVNEVQFDIAVYAAGMNIFPCWMQQLKFSQGDGANYAEFTLIPGRAGAKQIEIEFYYQRHWLTTIKLEVEVVVESLATMPKTAAGE